METEIGLPISIIGAHALTPANGRGHVLPSALFTQKH